MPSLIKLKALTSSSTDQEVYDAYGINDHQKSMNSLSKLRLRNPSGRQLEIGKSIELAIRKATPKTVAQFIHIKLYVELTEHFLNDRQCRTLIRSSKMQQLLNTLGQHSYSPLTLRFTKQSIQRIQKFQSGYLLKCRCKVVHNQSSKRKVNKLESVHIVSGFGSISGKVTINKHQLSLLVGSAKII